MGRWRMGLVGRTAGQCIRPNPAILRLRVANGGGLSAMHAMLPNLRILFNDTVRPHVLSDWPVRYIVMSGF